MAASGMGRRRRGYRPGPVRGGTGLLSRQAAARGDPQALVHIAYPGDGIPQFRQALEEGFFSKFVFVDSMKTSEMIVNVGAEFLNGAICAAPEAMETEAPLRLRTAYVGRYSEAEVAVFIGNAYDAMFIMALAIEKAGSADRTAARDALREVAGGDGMPILSGEWEKAKAARTSTTWARPAARISTPPVTSGNHRCLEDRERRVRDEGDPRGLFGRGDSSAQIAFSRAMMGADRPRRDRGRRVSGRNSDITAYRDKNNCIWPGKTSRFCGPFRRGAL